MALAPLAARADDASRFLSEQRFTGMKSFVMQLDAKGPQGGSVRTFTFVAPDKLRMDFPAAKLAVVVIGQLGWVRQADGKWQKHDVPANFGFLTAVRDPKAPAKMIAGKTVAYAGVETLDGVATHVFTINAPPKKGFLAKVERVWIGASDGFPRKIVESNGPYSSTATYSQLNAPLSVSGP